jgi:hypothetical protein
MSARGSLHYIIKYGVGYFGGAMFVGLSLVEYFNYKRNIIDAHFLQSQLLFVLIVSFLCGSLIGILTWRGTKMSYDTFVECKERDKTLP